MGQEPLCESAIAVIDEGWVFDLEEQTKASKLAERVPFFRVGSGCRMRSQKSNGGPQSWSVGHFDVGGVSDSYSKITQWHSSSPGSIQLARSPDTPLNDLRDILKAGVNGSPAAKPWHLPDEAVGKVCYLRKDEISCAGLFPTQASSLTLVRTKYGLRNWVVRELTESELLAVKDIPEPVALLLRDQASTSAMTRQLYESCRVPLKSLSAMLLPVIYSLSQAKHSQNPGTSAAKSREALPRLMNKADSSMGEEEDQLLLTEQELRNEELRCKSSQELVSLLNQRILTSKSELRSKRSDYELPSEIIWDVRVLPFCCINKEGTTLQWRRAFDTMRKVLLRRWKRSVLRSINKARWDQGNDTFEPSDLLAARDCATRVANATFWGWDGGSRPFFWNWPVEWRVPMRDGFTMWLKPTRVLWKKSQPRPADKDRHLMMQKLNDVRTKGYLAPGNAKSYISFFGVPKGDSDVRMVYDGTKSGLNKALWAPWFPLPTATSHLRLVDNGSWMADNDAGECFLNWLLDPRVSELCGVDLTHFLSTEETQDMLSRGQTSWIELWTRCAMGLRPSPYTCVKGMLIAKEIILGDRLAPDNIFRWEHVLLNLPGMPSFDSTKAWVTKRRKDGTLAADLIGFVDDLRPIAPTETECWEASQAVSKGMAWLGTQDASRKRNPPSKSPGPWAGVVVSTTEHGVFVSVSKKKWEKARQFVREIFADFPSKTTNYKTLESKVGYLVYVAQAYPCMKPYLAALYGTLNSWRPDRTPEGYKNVNGVKRRKLNESQRNDEALEKEDQEDDCQDYELEDLWEFERWDRETDPSFREKEPVRTPYNDKPPKEVKFVKGSKSCLEALIDLTSDLEPPLRMVRGGQSVSLIYGFGDASGKGFGSAIQLASGEVIHRSGKWSGSIEKERSSNYRELRNLVDSVYAAAERNLLKGCQLMLFTDNTTAERAFHKGGSASQLLHELVLRLRKLELTLGAELIIVHVSGKRMILSGADGVSRGDMNAGMMAGESVYSFIPLHQSAKERSKTLIPWIKEWAGAKAEDLCPDRWPDVHARKGTYIWTPPPAAADAVIDWLGDSIHKRSDSVHIVAIPRLMTARWRKTLGKIGDLQFEIPCGVSVWPAEMLEPLVLVVSLPLSHCCSEVGAWRFKGTKRVRGFETKLRSLWQGDFSSIGDSLSKLLGQARRVRAM